MWLRDEAVDNECRDHLDIHLSMDGFTDLQDCLRIGEVAKVLGGGWANREDGRLGPHPSSRRCAAMFVCTVCLTLPRVVSYVSRSATDERPLVPGLRTPKDPDTRSV